MTADGQVVRREPAIGVPAGDLRGRDGVPGPLQLDDPAVLVDIDGVLAAVVPDVGAQIRIGVWDRDLREQVAALRGLAAQPLQLPQLPVPVTYTTC